jgi:hypothetical protein
MWICYCVIYTFLISMSMYLCVVFRQPYWKFVYNPNKLLSFFIYLFIYCWSRSDYSPQLIVFRLLSTADHVPITFHSWLHSDYSKLLILSSADHALIILHYWSRPDYSPLLITLQLLSTADHAPIILHSWSRSDYSPLLITLRLLSTAYHSNYYPQLITLQLLSTDDHAPIYSPLLITLWLLSTADHILITLHYWNSPLLIFSTADHAMIILDSLSRSNYSP